MTPPPQLREHFVHFCHRLHKAFDNRLAFDLFAFFPTFGLSAVTLYVIECSVVVDVISTVLLAAVSFKFIRSLMCVSELISDVVFASRLLGCSSSVDFVIPAVVDSAMTNGELARVVVVVDVEISNNSFGSTEFVWICCCFFRFAFNLRSS